LALATGLLAGRLCLGAAQSDCTERRAIPPADRAALAAAMAASLRALPRAPAGWVITNGGETPDAPDSVCAEDVRKPWAYSYTREYSQKAKTAGTDAKVVQAGEALQKESAAKQPRLDALMAKITRLNEQIVSLVQKGDIATAEPLIAQRDKLQEEYERIANASDAKAGFEAAVADQVQDSGFDITIDINLEMEYAGEGASPLPTPRSAQAAFQYHRVAKEEDATVAVVLFGAWRKADNNHWLLAARPGLRLSATHGIAIVVHSAPERAASVLAAIDYPTLAAQIGK
jgi:hypothetical protein